MNAPTLRQLIGSFLTLGATGFGGRSLSRTTCGATSWRSANGSTRPRTIAGSIATTCPGPMAYQLGVYCGYITHGIPGALAVAVPFALPPFVIVLAIAALYERFSGAGVVRGLFYGIGPVVVALILRARVNLGRKTLKRDGVAWSLAIIACAVTIALQREWIWLFLAAGVVGLVVFAPRVTAAAAPAVVATTPKMRAFSCAGTRCARATGPRPGTRPLLVFLGAVAATAASSFPRSSSPSWRRHCFCATAAIRAWRVLFAALPWRSSGS